MAAALLKAPLIAKPVRGAKVPFAACERRGEKLAIELRRPWRVGFCALAASLSRLNVEMGRKDSARGPSGGRCFLLGPFRNDARIGAPLHREALSPPLVRMCAGLVDSHLRFLFAPCVPGVCLAVVAVVVLALATDLASGWRAFARASSVLAVPAEVAEAQEGSVPGELAAHDPQVYMGGKSCAYTQANTWELIPDLYRSLLHAAISAACLYQKGKTVNDLQREENQSRA